MPKKVPVNEVIALSRQGYTDADIIKYLRSEGYSSTEINDAVNQAKIKIELARTARMEAMPEGYEDYSEETGEAFPEVEEEETTPEELAPEEELRPSIMEQEEAPLEEVYAPEAEVPAPGEEAPTEAAGGAGYPAYGYGEAYYGAPALAAPAEAVEELVEEIINEKWEEFKAKVGDISELKRHIESRMKQLDDRIRRLELGFDKIQMTMMSQIQASGREVKTLETEVRAMQGAFSNILQPLVSSVKELREVSEEMKAKKGKVAAPAAKTKIQKLKKAVAKAEEISKKKR